MPQQQADALALVAETALHHGIDPGAPGERYQVVVHVDLPVLTDPDAPGQSVLDDGAHVSAETAQRLACDASRVVMRHVRMAGSSKSVRGREPFRRRCGARCIIAIADAASPAVGYGSAKVITSATGLTEGPPRSRISLCSVVDTTAPSTRRDTRSSVTPVES